MARRRAPTVFGSFVLCVVLASWGAAAAGDPSFESQGIRLGYSSRLLLDVSRSDAQAALALWARELNRLAGYKTPPKATVYEDLPTLAAAVRNREVDFVALGTLDYLKLKDQRTLEPALAGLKRGRLGDEQILLVRGDSRAEDLKQLHGRRLALLSGGGEIASLWLETALARRGLPGSAGFFGSLKEVGKAQQAVVSVFFGQADACVVTRSAYLTAAELNPQIGRDLTVLASSSEMPLGITCLRSDLSQAQKEEFISASLKLVTTPAGKQILTLFKVDGVVRSPPGLLDGLAALVNEHRSFKALEERGR